MKSITALRQPAPAPFHPQVPPRTLPGDGDGDNESPFVTAARGQEKCSRRGAGLQFSWTLRSASGDAFDSMSIPGPVEGTAAAGAVYGSSGQGLGWGMQRTHTDQISLVPTATMPDPLQCFSQPPAPLPFGRVAGAPDLPWQDGPQAAVALSLAGDKHTAQFTQKKHHSEQETGRTNCCIRIS